MIAYKFLAPSAIGVFSGFAWPRDAWVEAEGPLETCRRGIHACRPEDLPFWLDAELWEVELDGRIVAEERKLVAERGRLRRRLNAWPALSAEFAAACAERCEALAAADEADGFLAGWADDAARLAREGAVATAAYVAAHAAARAGGPAAQVAERTWQADWLAERLGLRPPPGPAR